MAESLMVNTASLRKGDQTASAAEKAAGMSAAAGEQSSLSRAVTLSNRCSKTFTGRMSRSVRGVVAAWEQYNNAI